MVNAFEAFPNLLSPVKIRGVMFRNRMFGAPMSSADLIHDGQPGEQTILYFERKARGGAAALIYGEVDVDPADYAEGRYPREVTRRSNYNYPRLARAVTQHGAVPVLELCFAGIFARMYGDGGGKPAWGPVDMPESNVKAMPEEKILEVIRGFGQAAMAAKDSGFGMVCLHGAHGFGLQQFMSPTINTRTDRWGGSPENRCRFAVMAIEEIRRLCGPDFPIEIRISASEIVKDGYGIDEGCRIAEQLDGVADIIHVSVGAINRFGSETFARTHLSMFYPEGRNVEYAAEVKKHVKKSLVAAVGGLSDPYYMEEILATGKADIVYMARELLCDPDMPNKVRSGKIEDIRKCLRCLTCFSEGVGHGDLLCAINPEAGNERETYYSLPETKPKRVLVVGGGISGMQAALTARRRGHDVVLCEKNGELGGNILCEVAVPFKKPLHDYILQQRRWLDEAGVDVRLNTEVTPEYAKSQNADTIIAAIGSEAVTPNIPGADGKNVHQAIEVFKNPALAVGKTVILGAGFVGTELAIYLKEQFNTEVEIIEMLWGISSGGNSTHAQAVDDRLTQNGIPVHFNTLALDISADGVRCSSPESEVTYAADTVILAAGMRPLHEEAARLHDCAAGFEMVGECRKSANIMFATRTAHVAAKYL